MKVIKPIKMELEQREKTKGLLFPKVVRMIADKWEKKDTIYEFVKAL